MYDAQKKYQAARREANRKAGLRSDGKPRLTKEEFSAVRTKAAKAGGAARWAGHEKATWRTIRVHSETYDRLAAMRWRLPSAKGRAEASWDALLSYLADRADGGYGDMG